MSEKVGPNVIGLTASLIVWVIKRLAKDSGVMEVIQAVHLQNKEGVQPTLIDKSKTDVGMDYVFSLPPGVIRSDFEKNRVAFETYLNCICEIESIGRKLTLKTYVSDFPKEIPFEFDPSLY